MSSHVSPAWGMGGIKRAGVILVATIVLSVPVVLAAGCGGSDTTGSSAPVPTTGGASATTDGSHSQGDSVQVIMANVAFDPETVTIKVGDTITWTNQDGPRHNVVAGGGEFKSGLFSTGETFSYTFTRPGTYPYECTIHPGMTGTVIVE